MIKQLDALIHNVEAQAPKFKEGSSQASLIKNRLFALNLSKALMFGSNHFSNEELRKAYEPMKSILRKNLKAQEKHQTDTNIYKRLQRNILLVEYCVDLINNELAKE